ncbi:MAG: DUF2080 family transposase-associated protein [Nitrososphaeraceae archaeon]
MLSSNALHRTAYVDHISSGHHVDVVSGYNKMILEKTTRTKSQVDGIVRSAGIDGSAGRIYVPKAWIGKMVVVRLKEDKTVQGGEKK